MDTVYLVDDDKLILDALLLKRGLFLECGFEICGSQTNKLKAAEEIRGLKPDAVMSGYIIKPVDDNDLADLLNRLSEKIGHKLIDSETKTMSQSLNNILKYLKEAPGINHSLETVGERFSIHPNSICNLFSKHLNTTFRTYLTNTRMERAARLLRTTDRIIQEIGLECGYNNYFYFTRVFDKQYGKTPSEYRRELHEK